MIDACTALQQYSCIMVGMYSFVLGFVIAEVTRRK